MIKFNKFNHTYTNVYTDEIYTSASTLIGKYKPPFDLEKMSQLVAVKTNTTQQAVKDMWKAGNKTACDYGTRIHAVLENWIKGNFIEDNDRELYIDTMKDVWSPHSNIKSEQILHIHRHKIAGTSDIIEDHGKYFNVFDFKSNKKFTFNNVYGNTMLYPLQHHNVCEFSGYSLQLSLYAYMQERLTGQRVGELACFYFNRELKKWFKYNTPYLKSDVINMLNHWYS